MHDFFKLFYKSFNSNTINEINKENKQAQQIIEICHNKYNVKAESTRTTENEWVGHFLLNHGILFLSGVP